MAADCSHFATTSTRSAHASADGQRAPDCAAGDAADSEAGLAPTDRRGLWSGVCGVAAPRKTCSHRCKWAALADSRAREVVCPAREVLVQQSADLHEGGRAQQLVLHAQLAVQRGRVLQQSAKVRRRLSSPESQASTLPARCSRER